MNTNKSVGRLLLNYFLRGLMVLLPIALTIGVIFYALSFLATALGLNNAENWKYMLVYFVIGIVIITTLGYFIRGLVAKQILDFLEGIVEKAPGLKFIFGTTRDITEAFVGENKKFTKPVLAHISEGVYRIGFVTLDDATFIGLEGHSVVYFPYSYGINGEMHIVENTRLKPLDFESSNVTKFVVSGGAISLD